MMSNGISEDGGREARRAPVVERGSVLARYWEPGALSLLFIAALVIRLVGIDWGLPNQNYPYSLFVADEPNTLNATLLLSKRLYDVGILRNQPFFYMAAFPVFVIYYFLNLLSGRIDNLAELEAIYIQDNSEFLLVGRAFVALVSALTVVLTYYVGKRMVNRGVGIFSAVFLLFSFGHVVYSTVFRLDPFLPFVFLLAFYLIVRLPAARPGKLRPYVLCGLAMGLAAATKITAFALIVPFVASIIINTPGLRQWPPKLGAIDRRYPFAFTVFLATVVALTLPGYVYQPAIAQSPVSRLDHSGARGYTAAISRYEYSLPWHLIYILPRSVGTPIYFLSLIGLGLLLFDKQRRDKAILFWLTILAFLLPIGYLVRTAWRDMLPLLPFFAIAAGYALERGLDYAFRSWPALAFRVDRRLAAVLILLLVVLLPAKAVFEHKALLQKPDTREMARDWIEQHIPADSSLAIESYGPAVRDHSYLQLVEARVARLNVAARPSSDDRPSYRVHHLDLDMSSGRDMLQADLLLEYLEEKEVDFIVLSSGYYGRFYNDAVDVVYPQRAAAARQFYDLIEGALVLMHEFVPDWNTAPGPVIKIYQVPDDLPDTTMGTAGEFEPFSGMTRPASAVGYYQFSPR